MHPGPVMSASTLVSPGSILQASLFRPDVSHEETRFVLALARSFFGGRPAAGRFGVLKTLARPALSGDDVGRGRRAAAVYALSLDNPAAALTWGMRRPNWTKQILTRGSAAESHSTFKKEKAL